MEEEKREHELKMKKMEAEMEQVFEMKVKEKCHKIKESEEDVSGGRRHAGGSGGGGTGAKCALFLLGCRGGTSGSSFLPICHTPKTKDFRYRANNNDCRKLGHLWQVAVDGVYLVDLFSVASVLKFLRFPNRNRPGISNWHSSGLALLIIAFLCLRPFVHWWNRPNH